MSGVLKVLSTGGLSPVAARLKKDVRNLTGRDAADRAQRQAEQAGKDALAQEAAIAARQEQQQLALQNMQANAQVDLSTDNLTSVIAGGMADLSGVDPASTKKKRPAGGLASSLGLNV